MIDDPNSLPPLSASDAPAPAADPAPPVDQPTPAPTAQPPQSIVIAQSDDNTRVLLNIADPDGVIHSHPLNFSTARRIGLGMLVAAQNVEDAAVAAFVAQAQSAAGAAALAAVETAGAMPS